MEKHPTASGMEPPTSGDAESRSAYAVVIEAGLHNYSAYVPNLPGCVATGVTVLKVMLRMERAIAMHTAGLLEDGLPIPPPRSTVAMIDAPVELVGAAELS